MQQKQEEGIDCVSIFQTRARSYIESSAKRLFSVRVNNCLSVFDAPSATYVRSPLKAIKSGQKSLRSSLFVAIIHLANCTFKYTVSRLQEKGNKQDELN